MTIHFIGGRFKFLMGAPSENGITEVATAAHEFELGGDKAIYWTVGCELTGEQISAMSRRGLADWDK
jgi:hypothetical protein